MLQRLLSKLYGKEKDDKAKDGSSDASSSSESTSSGEASEPTSLPVVEGTIQPALGSDASAVSPVNTDALRDYAEKQSMEKEARLEAAAAAPEGDIDTKALEANIAEALKTIYDPEIPVNIYELGLIYEVRVEPNGMAHVTMTLTAPNCPAAGILPGQVESMARSVDGVYDVNLDLTFEPPWTPDRMSDAAKLELGML